MERLRPRLATLWKAQRGLQTFEFALLLPIFLLLLFGMIDLGRGYFSWLIITNGAREGARTAVIGSALGSPTDPPSANTVEAKVKGAVSGLPWITFETGTCTSLCTTTTCTSSANADLCVAADNIQGNPGGRCVAAGNPGDCVTVYVRYNFAFIVLPNFLAGAPRGVFPLTAKTTMRLE